MTKDQESGNAKVSSDNLVLISSPIMTMDKFAAHTGLRPGQVSSQVNRGNLPSVYIGRLRLVNSAKLLDAESSVLTVPVMTFERFAEASGLREQQVISQAENNNLPTQYIGRLRLVDIAELTKRCLEQQ